MKNKILYLLLLATNITMFGQDNNNINTYEKLYNYAFSLPNKNRKYHLDSIVNKSFKEKDINKITNIYLFWSEYNSPSKKAIIYADSIILINSSLKNKKNLAKGYLQKGIQQYYLKENIDALHNFLKADSLFKLKGNLFGETQVKHYLAALKLSSDDKVEAFKIFKNNYNLFKSGKLSKTTNQSLYLKTLIALSNSYNLEKKQDSAIIYSKESLQVKLKTKNKRLYPYLLLIYGSTKVLQKDYKVALDSLTKLKSLIKPTEINFLAKYYLRMYTINFNLGKEQIAINYLNKIDSLYNKNESIINSARTANEILLFHFKENNNIEKQLISIEKILRIDSLLNKNNKLLLKELEIKYDTPSLIKEKNNIINKLNKGNTTYRKVIYISIFTLILISIVLAFKINIHKSDKKKFKEFMEKQTKSEKDSEEVEIFIKEDLTNKILLRLEKFEKSNKFIRKQYSLVTLAKELKTNSSYLSKIINKYKGLNFSNYLNKIRIEYAINRLIEDKKFRKYTINAIAKESGFNNSQSFSNAFIKKTKIKPSVFIKNLESK